MKTEIVNSGFSDGNRIETVKYTYSRADDYKRLGQLYYAYGGKMSKGEDTAQIEVLIAAQIEIIKGYGDA